MPDEEQAELRHPPPALPDGSMPTYGRHPLPGAAHGEQRWSGPFGWGPDLDRLDQVGDHGPPSDESPLLIVALIILGGVALSVLVAALAVHV
ncbi:hypothetical protein [Kribbella sp. NPDC003557]|uniref:hypothetical protein n=1 Tax=Kribbella sp. NPDC003557 TaxID=3154449 RepID=UPI0033B0FACC